MYIINEQYIEQLLQLSHAVWDGDLISKADRDYLVKSRYVCRAKGWNIITIEGLRALIELGVLKS